MRPSAETVRVSTRQAAEILHVHESSIKRWCNESLLEFKLTGGGHRRLSLDSLMTFARDRAMESELAWFRGFENEVWLSTAAAKKGDFRAVSTLILDWMKSHRVGYVYRIVQYLESQSIEWVDICDKLLARVMLQVGDDWALGCTSVDEEHYFTELVNDIVQFRRHSFQLNQTNDISEQPVAVLGCPGNELHELGLLMVRTLLEESGWRVMYLGPNIPVYEIAAAQRKYDARLLCISISATQGSSGYLRTTELLSQLYEKASPYSLILGGPGAAEVEVPDQQSRRFNDCQLFDCLQNFQSWMKESEGINSVAV